MRGRFYEIILVLLIRDEEMQEQVRYDFENCSDFNISRTKVFLGWLAVSLARIGDAFRAHAIAEASICLVLVSALLLSLAAGLLAIGVYLVWRIRKATSF